MPTPEFVVGSICAVFLVGLVVRDLVRVSSFLAGPVLLYAVVMAWFAQRGAFLTTAERLPPAGLLAGQCLMLLLIVSAAMVGVRAWREISLLRFFGWHSVRLPMGLVMISLVFRGLLASEFGWGAGIGEVLVGAWATSYVLRPSSLRETAVVTWCAAGFLDILVGMVTAVLTFRSPIQQFAHAEKMIVMSSVPMLLIRSFSMAVLTLSTILIFLRRQETSMA